MIYTACETNETNETNEIAAAELDCLNYPQVVLINRNVYKVSVIFYVLL